MFRSSFTDDPLSDYDRHEAEELEELENLPVCSSCFEHIQDDELWHIGDEFYCEECAEALFKTRTAYYTAEYQSAFN